MRKYDVMVGGHICLDLIPDLSDLKITGKGIGSVIVPGKLLNIGACSISTGGAVSNTGFALAKLGAKVAFSTKIGDDHFGRIILSEMRKYGGVEGVSLSKSLDSSYTVVISPPRTDRSFLHCTGANDEYSSRDLPLGIMRDSRIFHFGYPSLMRRVADNDGAELLKIFKAAKRCGCVTSLDMSLPDPDSFFGRVDWRKVLSRVLPHVDIFLPSFEEAFFMLDKRRYMQMKRKVGAGDMSFATAPGEIAKIAEEALKLGAAVSCLKIGTRGWLLRTDGIGAKSPLAGLLGGGSAAWSQKCIWCPAYKAENFAGSTGSGDSSIAGFLMAFSAGMRPEDCLKAAVCAGWQNVQKADSLSGIRTWRETLALTRSGRLPVFDPELDGRGWIFDEGTGVWRREEKQ